jgi:hypothetical protein
MTRAGWGGGASEPRLGFLNDSPLFARLPANIPPWHAV